jgi:hypothetical protein
MTARTSRKSTPSARSGPGEAVPHGRSVPPLSELSRLHRMHVKQPIERVRPRNEFVVRWQRTRHQRHTPTKSTATTRRLRRSVAGIAARGSRRRARSRPHAPLPRSFMPRERTARETATQRRCVTPGTATHRLLLSDATELKEKLGLGATAQAAQLAVREMGSQLLRADRRPPSPRRCGKPITRQTSASRRPRTGRVFAKLATNAFAPRRRVEGRPRRCSDPGRPRSPWCRGDGPNKRAPCVRIEELRS